MEEYTYPPYRHVRERDKKIMLVAFAIFVIIGIGFLRCSQEIFSDQDDAELTPAPTSNPGGISKLLEGDA